MKTSPIARCFALLLVLAVVGAAGCIRSEPKPFVARGGILTLVVSEIQEVDRVLYFEDGQTFAITPQEEGTTLALAQVRVINKKSSRVSLTLDEEAILLLEANGENFKPLNYSENSEPTTELMPEKYPYAPFLWGNTDILQGFEVTGWFIFEVPVGSKFTTFFWEDVESIRVNFSS